MAIGEPAAEIERDEHADAERGRRPGAEPRHHEREQQTEDDDHRLLGASA